MHNPKEIKRLKREYRRLYQNQWARQNRNKHEIRFTLTKEEYAEIKAYCQQESCKPTPLAKELLISYCKGVVFIPNREQLLACAKDLGLAINRIHSNGADELTLQKLLSAETQLLNYLKT
ncbi:MAG TPA: hypothetical protein DCG19_09045 [Cryomorphaceae bacterium]|nr:hypothetical protein [Owenweeksia sp.]MBF97404.1 hypothetical protein [Owenweeksia sp.]HAD97540.1 hypothetical protein [Cryomorphaceae bacterium]HBF20927.1 hypothetical protein [Cryomorphaceae bacterium]HCQ17014.1 hypothetical protein [Cryomorphaceae bacterium]